MMVGKIAGVGTKYIGTQFFAFIGPLIPRGCWYVLSEEYSHHGNRSKHEWNGIRIKWVWSSMILGYLRVWLFWLAVAMPFILMWGESVEFDRPEYLVSAGLLVVWALLMFFPGRLSAAEKRKLRLLAELTGGLALDPKYLDSFEHSIRLEDLGKELSLLELEPGDPAACQAKLIDLEAHELKAVFAYSRYAAIQDRAWRAVADRAFEQLEQISQTSTS